MQSCLLVLGLAACNGLDIASVEQAAGGGSCPANFCGGNAPGIPGLNGLFEFNLDGVANAAGFRLLGLVQGNEAYDLVVRDSRIFGAQYQQAVLKGPQLVGARILISDGPHQYGVVITSVAQTNEVVPPHNALELYELDWASVIDFPLSGPVQGGEKLESPPVLDAALGRMCEEPEFGAEWDESIVTGLSHSVVFEGDRIDPLQRTIQPVADNRWFNIGCPANLLAKLRLTRNTINTAPSWKQAQTAMKMLSADYCGTGKPFTIKGEPLVWRDRTAMTFWTQPRSLEARWNEHGAKCLEEPRLLVTASVVAKAVWPDIEQAILDECGVRPPRCSDTDPHKFEFADEQVTSANYP